MIFFDLHMSDEFFFVEKNECERILERKVRKGARFTEQLPFPGFDQHIDNGNTFFFLFAIPVPTKTQRTQTFWEPLRKTIFKGNPKSLNFYFLVIWWGKILTSEFYP